jgi:hypothetical protein
MFFSKGVSRMCSFSSSDASCRRHPRKLPKGQYRRVHRTTVLLALALLQILSGGELVPEGAAGDAEEVAVLVLGALLGPAGRSVT